MRFLFYSRNNFKNSNHSERQVNAIASVVMNYIAIVRHGSTSLLLYNFICGVNGHQKVFQ